MEPSLRFPGGLDLEAKFFAFLDIREGKSIKVSVEK